MTENTATPMFTKNAGFEIIAALPAAGDDDYIVTGLRTGHGGVGEYVTWRAYKSYYAGEYRWMFCWGNYSRGCESAALTDMINRAGR